jgi:ATP-dependent Clp protease ATP-binding subunit ClpB
VARIPARQASASDRERLRTLEESLGRVVFGQDDAVRQVAQAIKRSRAGLAQPERPAGCFLFTGPTGVGKTELAKQLASQLGNEFVRFDMTEYMEKHAVARLIGAPPGYVGFEEGGQLTEAVRRRPYSVVLLDEIEKAHADVFNTLLAVLDDGRLTDGQGRTVDFKNTIVIMTSNASDLQSTFRPEFLNRIDEIVHFHRLGESELEQVVELQVAGLRKRLVERRISLDLTDAAKKTLVERGYDPAFGARPLKRTIQREVENPLALKVLSGELGEGDTVEVDAVGDQIEFVVRKPEPAGAGA